MYDLEEVGKVSIIHRQTYPLSRQLDAAGGEIVLRRIESLGVEVLGNVSPKAATTETVDGEEVLTGIELDDGTTVPCRIAVFSIGIRPRDELAIAAGIKCEGSNAGGRGITIDDLLQTSAPDVYAIGECASWQGQTYGLIAPGIEMADILSFNLTQTETEVGGFSARKMVRLLSPLHPKSPDTAGHRTTQTYPRSSNLSELTLLPSATTSRTSDRPRAQHRPRARRTA